MGVFGSVAGPPKFQISSRKWNVAVIVGSIVLLVVGFGGVFYIRDNVTPDGGVMFAFIIALGVVTTLLFVGPGALYPLRKRIGFIKKIMPGGSMTWVRSHMYLPILALIAAFVHASSAPYRTLFSPAKVLVVLGVLVSIAGLARHHMIGLKKEALNVNVAINKLAAGQSRAFRDLVVDFTEHKKPLPVIEAEMAKMDAGQQAIWKEIRRLSDGVAKHFPREGGQTSRVVQFQSWRALHPIITIVFFVFLAWHVWDVLGGEKAFFYDAKHEVAAAQDCAACHSDIYQEWRQSMMSHAQTGAIMLAQLPVTLGENKTIAAAKGADQQKLFDAAAKTCINCHAPTGATFANEVDSLLPLNAAGSGGDALGGKAAVPGGNAAVESDGVSCLVCHSQEQPPAELAGFGPWTVEKGGANSYGILYGPLFTDPNPLPVHIHGMDAGNGQLPVDLPGVPADHADWWSNTITESQLCGACHNVKVDLNGNGLSPVADAKDGFTDKSSLADSDKDNILDQNELEVDANNNQQDLVLQTTYDEWQDYVVAFDNTVKKDPRNTLDAPLGCIECHMPTEGKEAVVDFGPGLISPPSRQVRSHTFVGVDYDLNVASYQANGARKDALQNVLDDRQALLQSAVTVEVQDVGDDTKGHFVSNVTVQNNLLAHVFPTGFAFARQAWLEVSAKTEDGRQVCLSKPASGINSPCTSGTLSSPQDDLRQCDPASISRALQADPVLNGKKVDPAAIKDLNIRFTAAFPANDCDPWLANYQKILTDGDPDGDGFFTEVPYQSFLPGIVKTRARVATQQVMRPLEAVRILTDAEGNPVVDANGQPIDATKDTYEYVFDDTEDVNGLEIKPGTKIIVSATLHFRHLPPYFIKGLADFDNKEKAIPAQAKINADAALKNLVVTDVVTAKSGDGAVLACQGPQNKAGASILDCVAKNNGKGAGAVKQQGLGGSPPEFLGTLPPQTAGAVGGGEATPWSWAWGWLAAAAGGSALLYATRRRWRRRARRSAAR